MIGVFANVCQDHTYHCSQQQCHAQDHAVLGFDRCIAAAELGANPARGRLARLVFGQFDRLELFIQTIAVALKTVDVRLDNRRIPPPFDSASALPASEWRACP